MREGYIALYRKLVKSPYYKDSEYVHLWVHLLLVVNHRANRVKIKGQTALIDINPGQILTSRDSLSNQTGINSSKITRLLRFFESEQQIEQQTFTKYRIITITNWDSYQKVNIKMDNKRTASEQQVNTNKNVKNIKNKISSSSDDEGEGFITKKKRRLSGKRLETFLMFWEAFNYKQGKAEAADAWLEIPQLTDAIVLKIVEAAKKEASNRPTLKSNGKIPKMAQGWISGRRWEDEDLENEAWRII